MKSYEIKARLYKAGVDAMERKIFVSSRWKKCVTLRKLKKQGYITAVKKIKSVEV